MKKAIVEVVKIEVNDIVTVSTFIDGGEGTGSGSGEGSWGTQTTSLTD